MNKHNFRSSFVGVAVLLLATIWAMSAVAQDQKVGGRPALGGHSFTESVDVPSPFVRTFIRNRLGAGKALDLAIPVTDIGGQPITSLRGDLIFAILDFEYQYAIKSWLGVRARILGSGRLGSDTAALLSEGVTMSTGFEFGWLIRLQERETSALALELDLANRSFTGVNISQYVTDIIDGVPASLVNKTPSTRGGAGLRYAWAASPLLGVSARGKTGFGESVEQGRKDVWFWSFATALDFDLRTKSSLPMGVAVGYAYDSFPEYGGNVAEGVHSTFVRFSYLGREDFLMSLDLSHDSIPISGDAPDLKGASVTISLRYYI